MRINRMHLANRLASTKVGQNLPLYRAKQLAKRYIYWKQGWKVTTAVFVVIFAGVLTSYTVLHVSADTAILVPNGDITSGWPGFGGTPDASCSGGTHCNYVDDGIVDKTSDYITTTGSTAGGEVEEYALTSVTNLKTASQVTLRIYIEDTSIGGGTTDTLTLNLRVNGALQTATTCTPTASWSACTAMFSGSWVQADVDSMQVYIQRNKLGSGNPSGQADTIVLANAYATLTYVPNLQVSQSAYRWFVNQDASTQTTFANTYGGSNADYGKLLVHTTDGGYATTGYTSSYGAGGNDMILVKYDALGNVQWSKTWGGTVGDYGYSIVQTTDGGYAITGYTQSFGAGSLDMFLVKYDALGNVQWNKTWGGTASDTGESIVQTSDGGFAVSGETGSFGATDTGIFLVKYDASGNVQWSNRWDSSGSAYDYGYSLAQITDGGYIITGLGASSRPLLIKYDASGNLVWSKSWGSPGAGQGNSVVPTTDGGFAIVATSAIYSAGSNDAVLLKFDASGTLQWNKTWGGNSGNEYGYSLAQASDGGYVITGITGSYGSGANDVFLAKYSSTGNLSWSSTWGGSGTDNGYSVTQTNDGGYVVTGVSNSFGAGDFDIVLLKYDQTGNIANCGTVCTNPTVTPITPAATTSDLTPSNVSSLAATSTNPLATIKNITATQSITTGASPSMGIGAPMTATQDTAVTVPDEGTIFRLRLDLHMSGSQVVANQLQLKLQYAPKGGSATCGVVPTGNFNDVTATSAVSYADNPLASNGMKFQADAVNDPKHGTDTNVAQTYLEKGTSTFSNAQAISIAQDGMWDFGLQTYHAFQNTTYCLRVVQSGGSVLDSYGVYPELTTPAARFSQASYRWYNRDPSGGSQTFIKAYGDTGSDEGNSLIQTSDGGYAVTGFTDSYGAGGEDVFIAKYNSMGNLSWSKTWGGTLYETGSSLIQTSDGGYAVTGYTNSFGAGDYDVIVLKFDASGTLSWSKTWGGTAKDYGNSLIQTSDGGYAITGFTASFGTGNNDAFLLKLDASGTFSWSKTWGGTSFETGNSLIQTSDGGYAITGFTNSYGAGAEDVLILKFDSSGTLSWSKTWGGPGSDQGYSLIQTSDGYAITGQANDINSSGSYDDAFLLKLDASGNLVWSKVYNINNDTDIGKDVIQTSDGGYAITGYTGGGTGEKVILLKLDASGTLSWSKTWEGTDTGYDMGYSLIQTSDGGYAITGESDSFSVGSAKSDVLLARFDSSGNIAGCPSTECQSPSVVTTSPPVSLVNPTNTITSPTTLTVNASGSIASFTFTTIDIVVTPISVGNPLALQNKPLDLPDLTPLSLRIALRVDGSGVDTNTPSLKLQYAVKTSEVSCQAVSTSLFSDVSGSTPIAYYDTAQVTSGTAIAQDSNDPNDGSRKMNVQTYQESNPFTNSISPIYAGEDGTWQFSLYINNTTLKGRDFCLRAALQSDSHTSLTALNVADVAYAPQMTQLMRGGNWFSRAGAKQNISL